MLDESTNVLSNLFGTINIDVSMPALPVSNTAPTTVAVATHLRKN